MKFTEIYNKRKLLHDALLANESGLLELVQDLYSDLTHFIYEILQNAEDAKATTIDFALFDDRLEIRHNGLDFTIEDIDGITNIAGKQNEKKENREKIGKFGIGFKSIYAITTLPRIQSGKFDFEIKNYLLPEKFSDVNHFESTIITIPFIHPDREASEIYELIKGKFEQLEYFNLLFLNNLNTIKLKTNELVRTISKSGKETLIKGSTIAYKTLINADGENNEYLIFKEDVQHEAFFGLRNMPQVSIAFKQSLVDGKLQVVKADTSKLFVFFETGYETFLDFNIHAPFVTNPARESINFQDSVNLALLNEVVELIKGALEFLRVNKLITVNLLNHLPINTAIAKKENVYWKLFETVKNEFISGKKYLPANDGRLLESASMVGLIRGKELKQILASRQDLKKLFNIEYWLDPEITRDKTPELRSYLIDQIKIREYGPEDFARVVTKEFFESKQNTWVKSFYSFLNGKQQSLYTLGRGRDDGPLRKKPIIRLANGKHTEPFDLNGKPKVFLPDGKMKVQYDTVHTEVISSKPSLEFIRDKLGIKERNRLDEIRQGIIPLYRSGVTAYPVNKIHLTHVDYILDVYNKGSDYVKSELIELISSEGVNFFRVKKLNSETAYCSRAEKFYLQNEQLSEYFRYSNNVYFLYDGLYASVSIDLLHEIASKCGAKKYVRKVGLDPHFSIEAKRQLRLNSAFRSDEITLQHGDDTTDYSLEDFNKIFKQDKLTKADSLLIWGVLLNFLKYNSDKEGLFRGVYWWFRNSDRYAYFNSQILLSLRSTKWLYSKQEICSRPGEITLIDLSDSYEIVSEEARFLIDKLQFKTEVESLYLNQIPEEQRNELIEAAELIRLSKEKGIDYKTFLEQRINEEKRAEYEAELNNAPAVEEVEAEEIDFEGFDNSSIDVETQDNNGNDAEKDKNKGNDKMPPPNQLPQDIKIKLGYRGERLVWLSLKKKWSKKFELIRETENEMEFKIAGSENYIIYHLNDTAKIGYGCDILIKQGEIIDKYIEVKSTKTDGKQFYSVSGYQWSLAHKNYNLSMGNKYLIYVVTNVLGDKPKITPIENPIKKWKDGKLKANPVNIEF